MTQKEFINSVQEKLKDTRDISMSKQVLKDTLECMSETITETVASGNEVRLNALGTFTSVSRSARMARNPQTGEMMSIPEKRSFKMKPCKQLRDALL